MGKRATEKSLPMENIHQEGFIMPRNCQIQILFGFSFCVLICIFFCILFIFCGRIPGFPGFFALCLFYNHFDDNKQQKGKCNCYCNYNYKCKVRGWGCYNRYCNRVRICLKHKVTAVNFRFKFFKSSFAFFIYLGVFNSERAVTRQGI